MINFQQIFSKLNRQKETYNCLTPRMKIALEEWLIRESDKHIIFSLNSERSINIDYINDVGVGYTFTSLSARVH